MFRDSHRIRQPAGTGENTSGRFRSAILMCADAAILVAWIEAALGGAQLMDTADTPTLGPLPIDVRGRRVALNDEDIGLTPMELRLLFDLRPTSK